MVTPGVQIQAKAHLWKLEAMGPGGWRGGAFVR